MRIGIDVSLMHKNIGMGTLLKGVLDSIITNDKNTYYLFSTNRKALNLIKDRKNIKKVYVPFDILPFDKQNPIYEQAVLPFIIPVFHLDKMYFPYHTMPFIRIGKHKRIVFIHDIIYLKSKDELRSSSGLAQKLTRFYRGFVVSRTIKSADKILVNSNFTRQDLLQYFPFIDPNNVYIMPLALDDAYFTRKADIKTLKKYNLEANKYFVSLLALDPRKNGLRIIESFKKFTNKHKGYKLIFIGTKKFEQSEEYKYVKKNNLFDEVIFTGFLDVDYLIDLYSFSTAFLYPSLFEGFGIPIIEAMSRKTPVITSNITSTEEIADGKALLVNPTSIDDIVNKMEMSLSRNQNIINDAYEMSKKFKKDSIGKIYSKLISDS